MTNRMPDAWRSLLAEVRTVEAGEQARWDDTRRCYLVSSISEPGTSREVTVSGLVTPEVVWLVIDCSCPAGVRGQAISPGHTRCRHAARVARRLEREGHARWSTDARWEAVGALAESARAVAFDASGDPPGMVSAPGYRSRQSFTDAEREAQLRASL